MIVALQCVLVATLWAIGLSQPETRNARFVVAFGLLTATVVGAAVTPGTAAFIVETVGVVAAAVALLWPARVGLSSVVAGGLSGGVGTVVESTVGRIAFNAIIGFDSVLASMAVGGRRDPVEFVLGTAFGGVGGAIDLGEFGGGLQGFARSLIGNGGLDTLLTVMQNLATPLIRQAGNGMVMSPAGTK